MNKNWLPSSPMKPPIACIRIDCHETGRMYMEVSTEYYPIKKIIEYITSGRAVERINDYRINCNGLSISCDQMKLVDAYEYQDEEEKQWELPEKIINSIEAIKRESVPTPTKIEKIKANQKAIQESKQTKQPKQPKPNNLISLADICKELNIETKEARIKLRKSNFQKPSHGQWDFTPEQIEEVRKIIK